MFGDEASYQIYNFHVDESQKIWEIFNLSLAINEKFYYLPKDNLNCSNNKL
jgi:hypothetical protein